MMLHFPFPWEEYSSTNLGKFRNALCLVYWFEYVTMDLRISFAGAYQWKVRLGFPIYLA